MKKSKQKIEALKPGQKSCAPFPDSIAIGTQMTVGENTKLNYILGTNPHPKQGAKSKTPRKPYIPAIYYQNLRIIKERGNRCEECYQENNTENKFTGKLIKLQVCHRNQNPADHSKSNVAVWCQWCHAMHDKEYKLQHGL